jgi:hypothetical protein
MRALALKKGILFLNYWQSIKGNYEVQKIDYQ